MKLYQNLLYAAMIPLFSACAFAAPKPPIPTPQPTPQVFCYIPIKITGSMGWNDLYNISGASDMPMKGFDGYEFLVIKTNPGTDAIGTSGTLIKDKTLETLPVMDESLCKK